MSDSARGGSLGGPARFVDLHTHSTASDGALAPRAVVQAARAADLAVIALTDHDTLDGLAEAEAAGRDLGVRVVAGVELSAVEGARAEHETHVLGLHLADRARIEASLKELRGMRARRAEQMVRRLGELGAPVAMEAVLREANGGAIGRPHVARALTAAGFATDARDAFERLIGNGRPAYVPKERLAMTDAIALIHAAGGIAVLAHPGGKIARERVAALAREGLDGIEVLHPSHSWDDASALDALAAEFAMVRSGGSDWHGTSDGARTLGMMKVPPHWVSEQEARIAARAA